MDVFMDYLSEGVIWEMYTSSGYTTFNGKAEVSQMGGNDMPEHTDFRFTTIIIEGELASVQGTSTSKKPDGMEHQSNFCDIYQFRDNKIVKITSYVVDNTR